MPRYEAALSKFSLHPPTHSVILTFNHVPVPPATGERIPNMRPCNFFKKMCPLTHRTAMLTVAATGIGLICDNGLEAAITLKAERVASGLSRPVFATSPAGDADRFFVIEQHTGTIKILNLNNNTVNAAPFFDINGLTTGNEQGLLGMAFHPDYSVNGRFYLNFTDSSSVTNIVEYTVANPASNVASITNTRTIIRYSQPFSNHNGGWIGFGPNDGYLYIASGDGGSGNDPGNRAQTITDMKLGKILRLDIDGPDAFPADANANYAIPASNPFVGVTGDDEIWAYGLRNPWRDSFDRLTGDLWIGDVGQGNREEINFQPGTSTGGENYGWRVREGFASTGLTGGTGPFVDPVHDYDNDSVGIAVTGGYVYRGSDFPALQGTYIFADYIGGSNIGFAGRAVWSFKLVDGAVTEFTDRRSEMISNFGTINEIVSFAEDDRGELYIVDLDGEIFRIILDRIIGDLNGDQLVTLADYIILVGNFGDTSALPADGDLNGDGRVNLSDLRIFKDNYPGDPAELNFIPEPGALLAGLTLCLAALPRRRRRRIA